MKNYWFSQKQRDELEYGFAMTSQGYVPRYINLGGKNFEYTDTSGVGEKPELFEYWGDFVLVGAKFPS